MLNYLASNSEILKTLVEIPGPSVKTKSKSEFCDSKMAERGERHAGFVKGNLTKSEEVGEVRGCLQWDL